MSKKYNQKLISDGLLGAIVAIIAMLLVFAILLSVFIIAAKPFSDGGSEDGGAVFTALLKSKSFQTMVHDPVLEVLRSPEGQELIAKAVKKELKR